MIINKLDIEGFGVFNNKRISGLKKGVNLLYGENEAGKSTLLDFVRFTLFDYPIYHKDRRPPINGGNHGGRVFLTHDSGQELEVYRSGNKDFSLILNGEKTEDAGVYNRLTNFASEQLFNNIFAITVDELNDISKLDESGMKDRIFSMGMGLSNVNLGDIEKKFLEHAESYYKERGSTQKLAKTTKELDEIESQISALKANIDEYEQLKEEEEKLTHSLKELEAELHAKKLQYRHYENYQKSFKAFVEIEEGRQKLDALKEAVIIPQETVDQLKNGSEQRIQLEETLSKQKNKIQQLEQKIKKLDLNSEIAPHLELIQYITANKTKFTDLQNRLQQIDREQKEIEQSNQHITEGLGADISIQDLLNLRNYAKLRAVASEHKEQLNSLKNQLERNTEHLKSIEEQSQQIKRDEEACQSALQKFDQNLESLKNREIELTAQIEGLKRTSTSVAPEKSNMIWGYISVVLFLLGGGLSFVGWYASLPAAALGLVFFIVYIKTKQKSGFVVDGHDHTKWIKERQEVKESIDQLTDLQQELKKIQSKSQQIEEKAAQLSEEKKESEEKVLDLNNKWNAFLRENQLPEYLKSDQIGDIISMAELIKKNEQESQSLQQEQKTAQDFLKDFREKMSPVANVLKKDTDEVDGILSALKEEEQRLQEMKGIQQNIQDAELEIKNTEDQIQNISERISTVLKEYNAETENEFFEKVNLSREKTVAQESVDQAEKEIGLICGLDEVENTLKKLQSTSKNEIDTEIIQIKQTVDNLSEQERKDNETLGALRQRISDLLNVDEMYELQNQKEALKARLEIEYNEWLVHKVALAVLHREKQEYEKEKQPSVIKHSSSIFSQLTQGSYERISISLTDKEVKIHTSTGKVKNIESLSRGTKEQLLLSLRLGFIQAYEEKNEPLPIVLDDVMVNFDYQRSKEFAEILTDFAKDRQAILFTCHQHIRDLFEETGAHVVDWVE